MRERVSVFVESTEETKEMFPEEIAAAVRGAIREMIELVRGKEH